MKVNKNQLKETIKTLKEMYPTKCKDFDPDCFNCRIYKCIETLEEEIELDKFARKKGWI